MYVCDTVGGTCSPRRGWSAEGRTWYRGEAVERLDAAGRGRVRDLQAPLQLLPPCSESALQTQRQETAFLEQFVLEMRFLVSGVLHALYRARRHLLPVSTEW